MAKDSPTTETEREQQEYSAATRHSAPPVEAMDLRSRLGRLTAPALNRIGETPRQASLLFSAQMGSTAAGFLVATIQMRWMEPAQIGRYAFCLALIVIAGLVFEFGLFPGGGRVLALLSDRESEKMAMGAFLLLTIADGLAFSVFVALVAFPADWMFKQEARWLLIGAAPAAFFLPAQRLIEESCQGLNRIRMLSEYRLITAGLQLAATAVLAVTHRLTAASALLAYLLAMGPAASITVVRLGVHFRGCSPFLKQTLREIRSYGLNAYIAAMTGTASARLDNLVITYLIGAEPLGLYFSAQRFSAPLSTMARALAITRFRAFARLIEVPRRIVKWNTAAMATGAVLLALAGPLVIKLLFPRYAAAAPLFLPFAVLNLFLGLFQPYNMFLASHGRGAELRNIAAAVTIGTVIALFLCVPAYGVLGAAWAGAVAMLLDYVLHLYYYLKLKADLLRTGTVQRSEIVESLPSDAGAEPDRHQMPSTAVPSGIGIEDDKPKWPVPANGETGTAGSSLVLLLDLSNDPAAAHAWAAHNLAPGQIQRVAKADLKWGSKLAAMRQFRSWNPQIFAVFCADLATQSAVRSIQVFGALAGAQVIVLADLAGRTIRCSRYRALLLAPFAWGFQLVIGYLLLAPLAWMFALALETLSPILRPALATQATGEDNGPPHPDEFLDGASGLSRAGSSGGPVLAAGSMLEFATGDLRAGSFNQTCRRTGLYLRATPASASAAGGMASHVHGFTSGALALGHRFDFISSSDLLDIDPASKLYRVPLSTTLDATRALFELWNSIIFSIKAVRIHRRHCRDRGWDFIYQRYNRFNAAGVLLSAVSGLPLILEYNGSEVWVGRNWDPIGLFPLLKRFELTNLRCADLIIVVSSTESKNLKAIGVPARKIVVNPNAVDVDEFHPGCGGQELRSQLGFEGKIVVGFLGSFGPWHGTDVLARAACLMGSGSPCQFLFIGAGDLRVQTEAILAEGGCAAVASFAGAIPHSSIPRYLDACDILVAPHVPMPDGSPYFGSPTKLFEYLAMGRPVVASRIGQMAELLVDGQAAILVEPGDPSELARAIVRLSNDEPLRRRLGASARALVTSGHTWRHNAVRVFTALEQLLGPSNRPGSETGGWTGGQARA
jgi:glycosyltransferase involved in cell wall biosynthesis/O-antigen/teichoic acid export membrane protein